MKNSSDEMTGGWHETAIEKEYEKYQQYQTDRMRKKP
jgi:hypothetical protein